jgi:hypothetical protein
VGVARLLDHLRRIPVRWADTFAVRQSVRSRPVSRTREDGGPPMPVTWVSPCSRGRLGPQMSRSRWRIRPIMALRPDARSICRRVLGTLTRLAFSVVRTPLAVAAQMLVLGRSCTSWPRCQVPFVSDEL